LVDNDRSGAVAYQLDATQILRSQQANCCEDLL
jgi:hypothetical protein